MRQENNIGLDRASSVLAVFAFAVAAAVYYAAADKLASWGILNSDHKSAPHSPEV